MPIVVSQFQCEAFLGMTQFPGLGIVIALPVKLPNCRKAKPYKQQGLALQVTAKAAQQVMAQVEPVHQSP